LKWLGNASEALRAGPLKKAIETEIGVTLAGLLDAFAHSHSTPLALFYLRCDCFCAVLFGLLAMLH